MGTTSRRHFLKTSAGVAASVSLSKTVHSADQQEHQSVEEIPAQKPVIFPGLHAYAEKSIAAGEDIVFRVSSSVPYDLRVLKLDGEVDDPATDIEIGKFNGVSAGVQPVHLGSYVHVPRFIKQSEIKEGLTLECWLRPWGFNHPSGIITQVDQDGNGFGLLLRADSRVEAFWTDESGNVTNRVSTTSFRMARRVWTHLVAAFADDSVRLYCNGELCGDFAANSLPRTANGPIRLGASGGSVGADQFLDGDIAMPTIYGRVLTADEVRHRFRLRALKSPTPEKLLACWSLAEESGERIKDSSENDRVGRIINHATWQVGGPSFRAESIQRYGQNYDPSQDGNRGHALRFCSDDLIDCRWQESHRLNIPSDAPSGVYVGRFSYDWDNKPMQYDCTFIVRRPGDRKQSPVLMICSTSTWLAYNCAPFPRPRPAGRDWNAPSLPGAPTYCCYHNHRAGQPTYYLGVNRPWPGAGADNLFSPKEVDYSHLMRGELFTHRWLDGVYDDAARYQYDVVTDWDLHNNPALLDGYSVVIVNGHSEYWSAEAFTGLDRYLSGGGNLMVMSGNTFFWRTSYNADGSV
ncbi:MAG: N,N-dimethylformamidase beta subunit family domain-containing protein, partial [Planctomycetota bacterium]|nr:N,N-dimethylformamidase beta subunit family domain-containing protein [Planctomycetota bacterium]